MSKKDIIVAVRMPKGLVDELKDLKKVNHFMDMSDEIRYVIRKYCIDAAKPDEKKEKLISELTRMLEELKSE